MRILWLVVLTCGVLSADIHSDAWQLIKLDGTVERLTVAMPGMIDDGKQNIRKACPICAPEFSEEWARRMKQRVNVNEFADLAARAYEKHLTDPEIRELIAMEEKQKAGKRATITPELKEKLLRIIPLVKNDVSAGSAVVAKKLGAQIGSEIGKEHPGYLVGLKK